MAPRHKKLIEMQVISFWCQNTTRMIKQVKLGDFFMQSLAVFSLHLVLERDHVTCRFFKIGIKMVVIKGTMSRTALASHIMNNVPKLK